MGCDRTGGCDTSGRGGAVRVRGEEGVLARSAIGLGDQKKWSGFEDDSDSGRELGGRRVVQDVGSGEARGDVDVADDFVPIEADSGFEKESVGDAPAIFGVCGNFGAAR